MKLPEQYLDSIRELLGEETEKYLACFSEPKALGLRVNTSKISVEAFLKITPFSLEPIPWTENGFYYDPKDPVTKHPHYHAGLYYIQEPSAMIPASRLPVSPGDRILDLCAAPGGKSTELAAKLQGKGLLVANDISRSRAMGLLKNLELFGFGNILVTSETPDTLSSYFPEYFDKILVDAPCSGEGMFRKDPDMIKSWMEKGPAYYEPIQREILKAAVSMLAPGGMLLYSTCTFSTVEDEETIQWLLSEESSMQLIPLETAGLFRQGKLPGTLKIWPQDVRGEGHFTALLKKEAADVKRQHLNKDSRKTPVIPEEILEFAKFFLRPVLKEGSLELHKDKLYLLPEGFPEVKGMHFLRTGLYLGEWKKKRFEPSQALAMYLKKGDFQQELNLSSEDQRVIRYLKGETIELLESETSLKGWTVVLVDDHPLGFGKAQNGSLKNKYYTGWRLL